MPAFVSGVVRLGIEAYSQPLVSLPISKSTADSQAEQLTPDRLPLLFDAKIQR